MIPRVIHYCWFGGKELPPFAQNCIASWRKHCPDYQIVEWNENNYNISQNNYMHQAYQVKKWGFVPDYARLDIIYRHGGVYLDTDVELLRPLDFLLSHQGYGGYESSDRINMGHGFGAEKGNEIIRKLRDEYDSLNFVNQDGSINLIASPQIQTKTFRNLGLNITGEKSEIDGFVIYPQDYFAPQLVNGKALTTVNTVSIHHYSATWQTPFLRFKNSFIRIVGDNNFKLLSKVVAKTPLLRKYLKYSK